MQFVLSFVALFAIGAEAKFSAKVEKVEPPAKLAEPIRKLLDPEALVVRDGDTVVMRVWFRDTIPAKATEEQVKNGITYREIPEGTLVGAIEFPAKFTDFRKQELAAGVYTLRFAVQPDIGDHTGTSPHPDFCLLCPAAEEKNEELIEKKQLIEISSKVNEGRHPAVLLMWPNNGKDATVKVLDKGNGVLVATIKRPVITDGGKTMLGFAVTVAGVRKE
ncbi:MAG: hypothetical protein C0467_29730 [Planctomycetaceae bacterium]|nr:hypothetical protein [Planctomycetaceae bacterium]